MTHGQQVAVNVSTKLENESGRRVFETHGYRIELDLSKQVLGLTVHSDWESIRSHPGGRTTMTVNEPAVSSTLKRVASPSFASAAMLAQKAKQVDDRIYAAVDLAAQRGAGDFPGKAHLVKSLLSGAGGLPPQLFAAAQLGGLDTTIPAGLRDVTERMKDGFLSNDLRSKPIGFYTWNDDLRRLFQQDRMLQSPLTEVSEVKELARAIQRNPQAREAYELYLGLVERLTNPLVAETPDLRPLLENLGTAAIDSAERPYFFIPPSRSHETELIKKLYGNTPIPEDFSLVEELIHRIASGELSLAPTRSSGWYDWQAWALESLVRPEDTPEAARLDVSFEYCEQLLELFKGILSLTRETHVKQLEIADGATAAMPSSARERKPVLTIRPKLSIEPTYSYYLRRAVGYRLLWTWLEEVFGADVLTDIPTVTSQGPSEQSLAELLSQGGALFHGAAVILARQLGGLDPAADSRRLLDKLEIDTISLAPFGSGSGDDAERFSQWVKMRKDEDVFSDSRMMVPVFYDVARKKTKVWAFLGWASRSATIYFMQNPEASVFDSRGRLANGSVRLDFSSISHTLPYPVMAEIYVDRLLDRDEFRAHCDRYVTRKEILGSLQ